MYTNQRLGGLGDVKRGWEGIDAHYNRAASNRFCFLLYYTGKTDWIEYWLKYLGEMGGGSGARTKEFIRRYTIFTNEVDQLASSLGFSETKREEILWQPAWATMVSASGKWTPPAAAIPPAKAIPSAAEVKILIEKYGVGNAYRIIKGSMTEAQAAAEVAAKLAAMKAAAEADMVLATTGTTLKTTTSVTKPSTLAPGTVEAATGGLKKYLPWILVGLAALLFGPKLLKQSR